MANAHGSATSWNSRRGSRTRRVRPSRDWDRWKTPVCARGRNALPAPPDDTRPVSRSAASPAPLAPIG